MQSNPDIARLLERFDEPLRDGNTPALNPVNPAIAAPRHPLPRPREVASPPAPLAAVTPVTKKSAGLPIRGLISALVGFLLVPAALLFVLLWQDLVPLPGGDEPGPAEGSSAADAPASTALAQPEQGASTLEVALSSPGRIEADAGEVIAFPIAIDATAALPADSLIAVAALPEGAAFSEGRPDGDTGWRLRPDEIGGLRLRLPARSGTADMRLELVAGDGRVLSASETQLSIAPAPAEVATTGAIESAPAEQIAPEQTASVADLAPPPQRKPSSAAANEPEVKVNTVKVVTVKPPAETRPYDGAYALGAAPAEPDAPAEWMETKTAVDMHARAEQRSETVKVAEGGIKVRVTARDKNWVQVHDPASLTTGWIYNRFLTPAKAPAP